MSDEPADTADPDASTAPARQAREALTQIRDAIEQNDQPDPAVLDRLEENLDHLDERAHEAEAELDAEQRRLETLWAAYKDQETELEQRWATLDDDTDLADRVAELEDELSAERERLVKLYALFRETQRADPANPA
jgi:predicted nuclease with TOPRIM domain